MKRVGYWAACLLGGSAVSTAFMLPMGMAGYMACGAVFVVAALLAGVLYERR